MRSFVGGDVTRPPLRVDSITQTVKSPLYQSLLPHEMVSDSTFDAGRVSMHLVHQII